MRNEAASGLVRPLERGVSLMCNQTFIELRASIEDLGGTLTGAQQAKFDTAMAPREAF